MGKNTLLTMASYSISFFFDEIFSKWSMSMLMLTSFETIFVDHSMSLKREDKKSEEGSQTEQNFLLN